MEAASGAAVATIAGAVLAVRAVDIVIDAMAEAVDTAIDATVVSVAMEGSGRAVLMVNAIETVVRGARVETDRTRN